MGWFRHFNKTMVPLFHAALLALLLGCGEGTTAPDTTEGSSTPTQEQPTPPPPTLPPQPPSAPPPPPPAPPSQSPPSPGPLRTFPGSAWQFRTPAEVGLDATKLEQFAATIGGTGCIVRHGYMVKTWGPQEEKGDWASAAKPVISTMLFWAVAEGKVPSVDDFIKDWGWPLVLKDQTMAFSHLGNMISGYARGEIPGSAWAYNDYGINLYAATIFDRVFRDGSPNAAAMQPTRLGALQFEDGTIFGSRGGYGVEASVRDFARIGWLWLNRGYWSNRQILPTYFFDNYMKPLVAGAMPRSTAAAVDYLEVGSFGGDSDQTHFGPGIYGFGWWFNSTVGLTNTRTWPDAPADTFQANGHFEHEIVTVIPSLDIVVAARGNWGQFDPGNPNTTMNENLQLLVSAVTP